MVNIKEYEKPQGTRSKFNSLCPPKEFPLKDITGNIQEKINIEGFLGRKLRKEESFCALCGLYLHKHRKVERWNENISFVEVTEGEV